MKLQAVQQRLLLSQAAAPRALHGRVAQVEGFSLHADTWVHENDRANLERLARYGVRGQIVQVRTRPLFSEAIRPPCSSTRMC